MTIETIANRKLSAAQAAKKFADTFWQKPRKIAWIRGSYFKLVDGQKVYEITSDKDNWYVSAD